jgi:hypothetical protein
MNEVLLSILIAFSALKDTSAFAFTPYSLPRVRYHDTALRVSVGLGPEPEGKESQEVTTSQSDDTVEPDHELFRDSRLSDFDRACDEWYSRMFKQGEPSLLGKVSEEARCRILTLPKLEREVSGMLFILHYCLLCIHILF